MNDQFSEDVAKWAQLSQLLKQEDILYINDDPSVRRWFFDNILVFFIQYTGFMFNQYIVGQPLIMLVPGVGLALLMLKGNAVIPGLLLSALMSYYVPTGLFEDALIFALSQIIPLVLFKYYSYYMLGPTLVDLSLKQQFLLYAGSVVLAILLSHSYEPTILLSMVNGFLITSVVILMVDLYFVDWYALAHTQGSRLFWTLLAWMLIILISLMTAHFIWPIVMLFVLSVVIMLYFNRRYNLFGMMSALFIFGFLQLCVSFFYQYPINDMLLVQICLLSNIILSLYLARRRSS